jgi:hypothetical protein
VARSAFTDQLAGTAESVAGVVIIEGLARQLGVESEGPVIHERQIDRERLAALAAPLTKTSGDELRTAARALWKDLYGEDLVPILDNPAETTETN